MQTNWIGLADNTSLYLVPDKGSSYLATESYYDYNGVLNFNWYSTTKGNSIIYAVNESTSRAILELKSEDIVAIRGNF